MKEEYGGLKITVKKLRKALAAAQRRYGLIRCELRSAKTKLKVRNVTLSELRAKSKEMERLKQQLTEQQQQLTEQENTIEELRAQQPIAVDPADVILPGKASVSVLSNKTSVSSSSTQSSNKSSVSLLSDCPVLSLDSQLIEDLISDIKMPQIESETDLATQNHVDMVAYMKFEI